MANECLPHKSIFEKLRFAIRLYITNPNLPDSIADFFSKNSTRRFVFSQTGFKAHLVRQQVRSCFYLGSTAEERWHFATSHFSFLEKNHTSDFVKHIYAKRPLTLLESQIKDTKLKITLDYADVIAREGFLRLSVSMTDIDLYTITFWFSSLGETPCLYIGALQGGKNTLEENRLFTKTFYGIRPQNMAMLALRFYAKATGVKTLLSFPKEKMRCFKKIAAFTDINEFWQEQGATQLPNTPFLKIATELDRKPLHEIASKKRSMYKQRYELLDQLEADLISEIKAHVTSPAAATIIATTDELSHSTFAHRLSPRHSYFTQISTRLKQLPWAAMIALAAALSGLHFAQQ